MMARKAALFAAMVLLLALLFTISLPAAAAMDDSQSPAPAPVPTNDGTILFIEVYIHLSRCFFKYKII